MNIPENIMRRPQLVPIVLAILAGLACSCTSANQSGGAGGAVGVGGGTQSGGASGSGGVTATGGRTGSGGQTAPGGPTGSGGSMVLGGATSSGGQPSSGGATSTGGRMGSSGATSSGGMTGAGGATSTGGRMGSGGAPSTGGLTGAGGTTSTGGLTGAGGTTIAPTCTPSCANKTCGSDGCQGTCGGCPPAQMCSPSGTCQTKSGSGILVDASSQLTPISPDIYGIAFADDESAKVTTLNRSVGDSAETYNWQKDITGKGAWWNCANYAGAGSPSDADTFVQTNKSKNMNTLMTIPITGWVANVATSSDSTASTLLGQPLSFCNYPQKADGTLVPSLTCCQAIGTQESVLVDNGSKSLDPSFMGNWVAHLVSTFGTAASGGVKYYQLDNEPDNWQNNRPDIYPSLYPPGTSCLDYTVPITSGNEAGVSPNDDILNRSIVYAAAVKSADPTAQVLFLSVMNPDDLVNLMQTECGVGTWDSSKKVPYSVTNSYAMAMMSKAAQYEAANHKRIFDCLDTHYPTDAKDFWQRASLSNAQGWIQSTYPGTGICVSEYSVSNDATDPTATTQEADFLGTFGVVGARLAAYWGSLVADDKITHKPVYNAFLMFRNYDGAGGTFGSVSIGAQSSYANVHAYAATDSATSPTKLWIMLVNRGTSAQANMTIAINNFSAASTARVYQSVNGAAPAAAADVAIANGSISGLSIAANTITLIAAAR